MTTNSFKALLQTPGLFEKIEICAGAILKTSNNHSMPKNISTASNNDILTLLNFTTKRLIKHGGNVGEREWGHDPLTAPSYVFSKKESDILVSVLKQSSSEYKYEEISSELLFNLALNICLWFVWQLCHLNGVITTKRNREKPDAALSLNKFNYSHSIIA